MIAVVTGASAGVGRATAGEFARRGWDVAILARNQARLEAAAEELRAAGARALPIVADVAEAQAVEAAAECVESELGPIDVWVNNAMATIFAPFDRIAPEEFRRGTEVTYLGQVHGTMAALRQMRHRDRGTIVNVGSALAYRAIPLQSVYCGAKYAVRGFTDSLRTELIHDRSAVQLVMVHLPAVNTPQFDWALNKTGQRPQPMPPIFQPEVPARAIVDAALHPHRREVWVGLPTWKAIIANKLAPGLPDRYLARSGYSGQLTDKPTRPPICSRPPRAITARTAASTTAPARCHTKPRPAPPRRGALGNSRNRRRRRRCAGARPPSRFSEGACGTTRRRAATPGRTARARC
jgi:NAD(P)-dependent dehydrogenase (short-subunit alcohol dehydrogenase family)